MAINSYNGEGIEHGTTYTIFKQIIRLGKSARVLQNGMLLYGGASGLKNGSVFKT